MDDVIIVAVPALMLGGLFVYRLFTRLQLSLAKHPSLRGHAKWSRRLSRLVPYYEFDDAAYFAADGAPANVASKRRAGLNTLAAQAVRGNPKSLARQAAVADSISDVVFTSAYRVPFPFRRQLPAVLKQSPMVEESAGVRIRDVDGNWRYDLSGSYGVNVFGYDFYKQCIEEGMAEARRLGPVLGPYHPLIVDTVDAIVRISGLDEVSFHMSGTEAVMQAVRLARYHTGRSHLVRFCGAYHGWWDGVQPGVGNQRRANDVYTLADVSDNTLRVLESRRDIACVLVNPLQALHPNADAPGDATLLGSGRGANFDRAAYTHWLQRLRDVCARRNIVLIFDEVFTGFRLGYRGAQEYFGIQADMVTYGKSIGGGLPVGVLSGRRDLMKRYKEGQPANISFARGTFNSHPYVIASMHAFLKRIEQPRYQALYARADELWSERARQLNDRLHSAGAPVAIANLQSVWTVLYTVPCRYNWMFQFYLRAQGLELSWVGSGRMIMSLDYSAEEFEEVAGRFVNAAQCMAADGWWWQSPRLTHGRIKRQLMLEMLRARLPLPGKLAPGACPAGFADDVERVR